MNHENFLVTTLVSGRLKNVVWDSSTPFGIGHPFRWVLERTAGGVRIRDLSVKPNEIQGNGLVLIRPAQIESGQAVELPGSPIRVKLKRLNPLPPAYRFESKSIGTSNIHALPRIYAFSGQRRTVITTQPIHTAYVAYCRGKPVFSLLQNPEGFKVKALLNGVSIKVRGAETIRGNPGDLWQFSSQELMNASISRGNYWWRFNAFSPSTSHFLGKSKLVEMDEEASRFYKTLGSVGVAILLLLTSIHFLPKRQAEAPKDAAAIVQRVILKKSPVLAKPAERPVQKPGLTQNTIAKAGEGIAKGPNRSQKRPSKAEARSAKLAAENTKILREALGGAMALAQRKLSPELGSNSPTAAKGLFNGKSPILAPTDIKANLNETQVKVGTIGGKSTKGGANPDDKVGYGTGEHGKINGQGLSFASVDSGGSSVDEGLTKEEVGAVIHSHLSEIRYCHDAAMIQKPKIEGKLVLGFKIGAAGNVLSTSIQSSTLDDQGLEGCVIRRLKRWKFPKPRGGGTVSVAYPFLFKTLAKE